MYIFDVEENKDEQNYFVIAEDGRQSSWEHEGEVEIFPLSNSCISLAIL